MDLWLRAFAVLSEDPGLVSTWWLTPIHNSGSRGYDSIFWSPRLQGTFICTWHINAHANNYLQNK